MTVRPSVRPVDRLGSALFAGSARNLNSLGHKTLLFEILGHKTFLFQFPGSHTTSNELGREFIPSLGHKTFLFEILGHKTFLFPVEELGSALFAGQRELIPRSYVVKRSCLGSLCSKTLLFGVGQQPGEVILPKMGLAGINSEILCSKT